MRALGGRGKHIFFILSFLKIPAVTLALRAWKQKGKKEGGLEGRNFLPFCFSGFARFFSAGFEAVFCKAKYATKEDVALDPPNPFAGNDKELPNFV